MSAWFDRLLFALTPDHGRLHVAHDPDVVLLDEDTLSALADRGFTVLTYQDEVTFRLEFETRFRTRWDDGAPGETPAVLLHYSGESLDDLPWDVTHAAVLHRLSLAELFPDLELSVVRAMPVELLSRLFDRYLLQRPGGLGANATADFILLNVFKIADVMIETDADLLKLLLDTHFCRVELPRVLVMRLAAQLSVRPGFAAWPLVQLFADRASFLLFIEERWRIAVGGEEQAVRPGFEESPGPPYLLVPGPATLPFGNDSVRAILDNLFTEGHLPRFRVHGDGPKLAPWMLMGVQVDDQRLRSKQLLNLKLRLEESLPASEARHGDWVKFGWAFAELLHQWHAMPLDCRPDIDKELGKLQASIDERFSDWLAVRYGPLSSLPAVTAPVMGHHVAPYLNRRAAAGARVALVIMDGMAMDQWLVLESHFEQRGRGIQVERGGMFAWMPTLTSIARQAIFAGMVPRYLKNIGTTQGEPAAWTTFWASHGLAPQAVGYIKGIQRADQLDEVDELTTGSQIRALGVVVDAIDVIMHGMTLGTRGLHKQVATWAEQGVLERLFNRLLGLGFEVFVTADHGNIEARGCGKVMQGILADTRGERVRIYEDKVLCDKTVSELGDRAELGPTAGLPGNTFPVYATGRTAFVAKGSSVVAHGGRSLEELVVPFICVRSSEKHKKEKDDHAA